MDADFAERLKNFEAVWQRVQKSKAPASNKQCPQCRRMQQGRKNPGRGRRCRP